MNGFGKFVDIRPFSPSEKAYIKDTRIPVDFLVNTVKEKGSVNSFFHLYPWLRDRKKELLLLLSYVMDKGVKHSLYD